jgi:hypothetical protein
MGRYVYISLIAGISFALLGVLGVSPAAALVTVVLELLVWWLTRYELEPRLPAPTSRTPALARPPMLGERTALPHRRYHAGQTGAGRGEDEVPDERLTLREAAVALGISEGGVRKRVKRGSLRSELGEDGRRYVYLDGAASEAGDGRGTDGGPDAGTDALVAELRDRVRFVERQLEAERQAHAEARRIIGGLVQRIPELEAPAGPSEDPEASQPRPGTPTPSQDSGGPQEATETPQRRSWWSRLLGG